jgi:hypothetical protein
MMADGPSEVILTWNFTNLITVFLMAAISFALVATLVQFYHNRNGS